MSENQSSTNKPKNATSSSNDQIFAPLNIPWHRRCETLTILVWWLLPWSCLGVSIKLVFVLIRWYVPMGHSSLYNMDGRISNIS